MRAPAVVAQPEADAVATAIEFGPVLEHDVAVAQASASIIK